MPPPPSTKRKSLKELQELEQKKPPVPNTIVVTGLPGSGKTSLAATLFSPEVGKRLAQGQSDAAKREPLTLKGAIWVEADDQGLVSLKAHKIFPEFTLNLNTLTNERNGDLPAAIRDLHAYITEAATMGAVGMVVDTITSFGQQWLVRHYVDNGDNGFAGWQAVANEQQKLLALGQKLGLRQVWLAQPAENKLEVAASARGSSDLDKAKALAQGVSGGTNFIVPSIAGKSFPPTLNSQCSMSSWLRARVLNGKRVREFLPFGGDGSQGKTRYEGILAEKEPADLAAMDKKILTAVGK